MFKLAKKSLDLGKIHGYTRKSVTKHVSLNVLLLGTIITLGYTSKTALKKTSPNPKKNEVRDFRFTI
jgi:hypothetical protein